jgi:cytochrome c oxidase subunit I
VGLGQLAGMGHRLPTPRHNFTELPRIRSERPAFDLHYPHMVEPARAEKYIGPLR